MSRISAEAAFSLLAKWCERRTSIQVVMSRSVRQRAASRAVVNEVLPHSQKALLTLRDENGDDVSVTVSLEGAQWEYDDAGAILPDFADIRWEQFLVATFPNGNCYVFGEHAEP